MFRRKKIGLALGGGSAKGFAHIGVLKVLEENGIDVDIISGTSIGSLIGALYCSGYKSDDIYNIIKTIEWKKLIDFKLSKKGLIKGDKIEIFIRNLLKNKEFKDLDKKLLITAVDVITGEKIVFDKGNVAKAVRSSISIPGIFVPVENEGRILVDGGLLDNLPIKLLKDNGAELVIAVNLIRLEDEKTVYLSAKESSEDVKINVFDVVIRSLELIESNNAMISIKNSGAEVVITPNVSKIKYHDFNKFDIGIEEGRKATMPHIENIKKLRKRTIVDFFKIR
jgi:NTE family protein